ncbi:hypothetical protein O1611_g3565 [Lasiodiplodia mahajangana]|uniref:Uncharacterized protein n=1 Tax=Lasiodiplodia mahajangana TaxID=1108764 RepID=A0ACC2JRK6_9PEZI|nr:hypothetical protein O1611_g3565 [Lasiodiplodia mahajangana]
MSSFAAQPSPFLQAGTGQTLSSFANPSSTKSPFALPSTTSKSIFNSGINNAKSPFGQITSSKPFGPGVFGGFGGGLGGPQLTTFGKPGELLKSSKPTKPFGAPASDSEGEGEEEEDGSTSENDKDDTVNQDAEEDKAVEAEDKKKTKLQRVAIDDGEAGEATIIQVRGKLYNLDKTSNSWKERGAGNLKINVPMACVRADDPETPRSGTFDASALKNAESKVVRLVMRQDSTHRVILNTAIIPTMKFQEKSSLKATYILFTAIEDEGAVSVQIKMNAANAKSFLTDAPGGDNGEAQRPKSEHTPSRQNIDHDQASSSLPASKDKDSGYQGPASRASPIPNTLPNTPSGDRPGTSSASSSASSSPKRKADESEANGHTTRPRKRRTVKSPRAEVLP